MNEYQLFDVVHILSTKDVKWMSAPKGKPTNPKGYWCIIGIRGDGKFVLSKDDTVIVTELSNIKKIANYDLDSVFKQIRNTTYKKKEENNDGDEGQ